MDAADDLVLDALGDRHRRAIIRMPAQGPRPVRELAAGLPISRPAVSRHLRLLKDAGLVVDRPAGNERIYQLHAQGIGVLRAYVDEVRGEAIARFRLLASGVSAWVLARSVSPGQYLRAFLCWLLTRVAAGITGNGKTAHIDPITPGYYVPGGEVPVFVKAGMRVVES
jgi:DNA-binding transcriptional ArsR family regulator